jgi:hypothetical protein
MKNPTAAQLETLFSNVEGDLIFYRTHHSGRRPHQQPCAASSTPAPSVVNRRPSPHYCLVTYSKDSFLLEKRQVPYDDAPLREAFLTRNVPERENNQQIFLRRPSFLKAQ